jgi:hypothetical protein
MLPDVDQQRLQSNTLLAEVISPAPEDLGLWKWAIPADDTG